MSAIKLLSIASLFAVASAFPCAAQEAELGRRLDRVEEMLKGVDVKNPRLVVAGREITKEMIDAQLVYLYGRQILDLLKLRILMEEEIENQIAAGRDSKPFEVLNDEVDAKIAETRDQFAAQYPDLKFEEALMGQGHTPASFRLNLESTLKFDRVFLPENPADWPAVTDAAIQSKGGAQFWEQMKESMKKQWDQKQAGEEVPPPNALYQRILRQWVIQGLTEVAEIKEPIDGLAPDVVLSVNGREVRVDEVLPMIEYRIKDHERAETLKWLAITSALQADLEARGFYLSNDGFKERWQERYGKYIDTPFNPEVIALAFKKFPSMSVYRTFFRLQESFRDSIEKEINDENLAKHAEYARDFLGDGKVNAEVILISAWNFYANAPRSKTSFQEAEKRAHEVFAELRGGAEWDAVLEENSGFIDPPDNPQGPPTPKPRKGRFGMQGKNPLKNFLGETQFNSFLQGYSVGDIIFHEMEPGDVFGPIQGPYGYYIVWCKGRTQGYKAVDIQDENKRELVLQDYMDKRFLDWANDAVEKASIEIQ